MTARAQPTRHKGQAGSGLLLFAAAVALGLGLGKLALVLSLPQAEAGAAAVAAAPGAAALSADASEARTETWQPLFGERLTRASVREVPEPEEPEPAIDYVLKGVVSEGGGGWAMIDDGGQDMIVRVGDPLPGGERVVAISSAGLVIEGPSGQTTVAFSAELPPAQPAARDGLHRQVSSRDRWRDDRWDRWDDDDWDDDDWDDDDWDEDWDDDDWDEDWDDDDWDEDWDDDDW